MFAAAPAGSPNNASTGMAEIGSARLCANGPVRTIARNRPYRAKHRFSPDCEVGPEGCQLDPGSDHAGSAKNAICRIFQSGRQVQKPL